MSRVRVGDVFEIETTNGKAYFQIGDIDPVMGELIRVLPGEYRDAPDLEWLVEERERFWTFFPVGPALHRKIIARVARTTVPTAARIPPPMRAAMNIQGGLVQTWRVPTAAGYSIVASADLSEDQVAMPIEAIWNDTMLIDRISANWMPGRYKV